MANHGKAQIVVLDDLDEVYNPLKKKPTAKVEFSKETEGLRKFGINLAENHMDGYTYRPDRFEHDRSRILKPWEVGGGLLHQMGPAGTNMCESIEEWNNPDFIFEIREGIAYCTLNRPAANNAMNDTIGSGFHDAGRILRSRPDIRIAVLTGNGRMFCAGGDPKSFQAAQAGAGVISGPAAAAGDDGQAQPAFVNLNPPGPHIALAAKYMADNLESAKHFARDMYEWASLPQFTICCLNGSAMGGGVGLVCACDYAIAVKAAHASLSEVKLGVIPAVISPHVIRTIGVANAKRLFCTAENANMTTALEMGFVQRVVNDISEFPAIIKEMAQKIQACAPGAVAAAKQTILNCLNQPMSESLMDYTAKEYTRIRKGDECEEGMKAFAAKQRPYWVDALIDVKEAEVREANMIEEVTDVQDIEVSSE